MLGWGPRGQWGSATQRKTVGTVDSTGASVAGDNNSSGARRGGTYSYSQALLESTLPIRRKEDAVFTYLPLQQSLHCS